MIEHTELVKWIFFSLISGVSIYAVNLLKELTRSVSELNIKVAIIIARTENHEKRLDRLENK